MSGPFSQLKTSELPTFPRTIRRTDLTPLGPAKYTWSTYFAIGAIAGLLGALMAFGGCSTLTSKQTPDNSVQVETALSAVTAVSSAACFAISESIKPSEAAQVNEALTYVKAQLANDPAALRDAVSMLTKSTKNKFVPVIASLINAGFAFVPPDAEQVVAFKAAVNVIDACSAVFSSAPVSA